MAYCKLSGTSYSILTLAFLLHRRSRAEERKHLEKCFRLEPHRWPIYVSVCDPLVERAAAKFWNLRKFLQWNPILSICGLVKLCVVRYDALDLLGVIWQVLNLIVDKQKDHVLILVLPLHWCVLAPSTFPSSVKKKSQAYYWDSNPHLLQF